MIKPLSQQIYSWAIRCFGLEHVQYEKVRALRIAEEAVELAQATGVDKNKMHDLVDIVYGREIGEVDQELGGVLLTTTVLCVRRGYDPEECLLDEFVRVLQKPPQHFAQRNEDKIKLGLK